MSDLSTDMIVWLEQYKKNSVKTATYDRLIESYRMMNEYPISKMQSENIRCEDIQNYINSLTFSGYALTTIKKQFLLLTAFYKHRIAIGIQQTPFYIGVTLPSENRVRKKKKEIRTYSNADQEKMRKELMTLRYPSYAAILLMLECGLRVGETLALKWCDIDFARISIHVHRTLVRTSTRKGIQFVQDNAKTKTSNRTIPLSRIVIEVLRDLKDRFPDREYVFSSEEDLLKPITYSSLRYVMKCFCRRVDVLNLGFHALRHTFASNCYARGADVKLLSKLLGHADTSITYNTYIHLFGDELEAMRSVLE